MDKFIIIGSVLAPSIYQQWIDAGEIINPSHQNYFFRFAQALAMNYPVQIVSLPPLRKTNLRMWIPQQFFRDEKLWYIQFSYLNHPILRPLSLVFSGRQYIRQLLKRTAGNVYVFIDGNSQLANQVIKPFRRHPKLKKIGIYTDDPRQLSTMQLAKAKRIIHQQQHQDAYIAISQSLGSIFNPHQKPSLILPGIIEVNDGAKQHARPYFFFSGALYPRYGIEAMIKGFLAANVKGIDLLIAGFGPEASMIEKLSQGHRQIKYLGLLSSVLVQKYQAGAYANINPRPLEAHLDAVAIPSKVFDYIAAGVPCLTTRHPFFDYHFQATLSWIEDASEDGIRVALNRFVQADYSLLQTKANQAKKQAIEQFGIATTGQALLTWLSAFK